MPIILVKAAVGAAVLAVAAWQGFSLYDQPRELAARQAFIAEFLELALDGDSTAMAARSARPEPIRWALEAARADSTALREWTRSGGSVGLVRRGDTLTVTLRRHRSTPRCSFFSSLAATMVAPVASDADDARLLGLSLNCLQEPVADTGAIRP